VVLVIGGLLATLAWDWRAWWLIPLLLFAVRPLAVWIGLAGSRVSRGQRWLMAWFGIRGVGSIYYLMYALNHGLPREMAQPLVSVTLATVVASIVLHGISVTPLMSAYERMHGGGSSPTPPHREN
jgi:NhaP-type Na+/H+ or K+/H+ antiporter